MVLHGLGAKLFNFSPRKCLAATPAVFLAAGTVASGYVAYLQFSGNFHTVVDGELYRSAQPSPSQLQSYIREYGIKTVINLRGLSPGRAWYEAELEAVRSLGVDHIDYRMASSVELTAARADDLVEVMSAARKPILVHCEAGSDRTGLVSALYSFRVSGQSEGDAERQLSFYFGHIGIPLLSSAYAMDASWEALETYYKPRG